jgi:AbrB family looped-hinge helix DNA binding protein
MEANMEAVTLSPKYQIVIPHNVRESMNIKPGAKIQVIQYENRLELIPIRDPKSLRGFLRGIDTKVDREQDRV